MHSPSSSKRSGKRQMSFELNLVPFIDVLSTLICFLLVTTVFLNLGAFNVNQAIGDAKAKDDKKKGSVTLSMGSKGEIRFEVKDVASFKGRQALTTIHGENGQVNFAQASQWLQAFSSQAREVKTAMILPNPMSRYDDIIQLMAMMKKNQLDQIGIAPL
jgi:biopolymer transport protein ExbD